MARASTDARALQSDLKLLIQAYDRRDKDFHVRRVEDVRRLVTVMEGVGVASQKMRLITRGEPEQGGFREMDISLPDWVSEADLGPFVKCEVKRIKARNEKKEDSYRKHLGLMPLDATQESCGFALAQQAALGLAVLAASLGRTRSLEASRPGL